jgi:hypothetical protein
MQHLMFTKLLEENDPHNATKLTCFTGKNSLQLKFSKDLKLWTVGTYEDRSEYREQNPGVW